jgi:mannose-6-phosphate isomerase
MNLYPLKFKPIFKEKIWGGNKIKSILGLDYSPLPNCGELWALSGIDENPSIVTNGFLEENELNELVEVYMGDLVGDKVFEKYGNEFPVLIKFIDAQQWLSVQVHPDDKLAKKRHQSLGKSEMWYVLQADEKAELISGFSKEMSEKKYLDALSNKELRTILNFEKVRKGDVYNIPAGRVHSLGPGIFIAEIQQTSDVTYRIYDWDRQDEKGNERELHTEEALAAIDFSFQKNYKTDYHATDNISSELVSCEHFTTNMLSLTETVEKDYFALDSFVAYVCIEGAVNIAYPEGKEKVVAGETILIPAELKELTLIPEPTGKLLEVYIK